MGALNQEQTETLNRLFAGYGIPEYIWRSIAWGESELNPSALSVVKAGNSKGLRPEESRGLFQINVQANPQFSSLDLYDPIVNATIAAQHFLRPAYAEALKLYPDDPQGQALYTWRTGIKPNWGYVTGSGRDKLVAAMAQNIYAPANPPEGVRDRPDPAMPDWNGEEPGTGIEIPKLTGADWIGSAYTLLIYLGIFLLILFSLYMVFRPDLRQVIPG